MDRTAGIRDLIKYSDRGLACQEALMNTLLLLRYLWYLPVRIFASCNQKPQNPRESLKLDADIPVVYVMQSDSSSNLRTLEKLTRTSRLTNPFVPVTSLGEALTRTVFIKKVPFETIRGTQKGHY